MMPLRDPAFVEIRNRDLREGQHRNETSRLDYFTTAYFHRPEELPEELADAGFSNIRVLGVEGPAVFSPTSRRGGRTRSRGPTSSSSPAARGRAVDCRHECTPARDWRELARTAVLSSRPSRSHAS